MSAPIADVVDADCAELRDLAGYFEKCGRPLNANFLRSVATRHEVICGAYFAQQFAECAAGRASYPGIPDNSLTTNSVLAELRQRMDDACDEETFYQVARDAIAALAKAASYSEIPNNRLVRFNDTGEFVPEAELRRAHAAHQPTKGGGSE